ncbi:hypothetical protein V6N11_008750 [Hibiscus sabdariffa]|uniref:Uncharacterized protein n=1 Tax=Hibiscus sabdariffa TaxID=183260 RepID=A0ABR2NQJ5_9ROSI
MMAAQIVMDDIDSSTAETAGSLAFKASRQRCLFEPLCMLRRTKYQLIKGQPPDSFPQLQGLQSLERHASPTPLDGQNRVKKSRTSGKDSTVVSMEEGDGENNGAGDSSEYAERVQEPIKPTYAVKVTSTGISEAGKGVQRRFLDEEGVVREVGQGSRFASLATEEIGGVEMEAVTGERKVNKVSDRSVVSGEGRNEITASKKIVRNAAYMTSNPEMKNKKSVNGVQTAVVVPTVEGQECQVQEHDTAIASGSRSAMIILDESYFGTDTIQNKGGRGSLVM